MALQFELAGAQIDGSREYQEDAFLITHLTDKEGNPSALIIIADGMGGHAAGNVASNMAVQAFSKHFSANYPADNPADVLHQCVAKANNSIKETVKETPALAGMGCTMVAAILEAGKLWWASVGDSHLYLIRGNELAKKNADHSYGGFLDRMTAAGTPVEPEPGLARNMLMSAITGEEINEIDVSEEPLDLQAGDRIILCSDGMDTLSRGKIIQFSESSKSPKECTDALLNAINEAGMPKQDNTTVVVVNAVEKAVAKAAPAPETVPAAAVAATEPPATTAEQLIPETPAPAPVSAKEAPKKSNTGLIIGIAAVVVIGIAVGTFMVFGGKKPASVSQVTDVDTSDAVAEEVTEKTGPASEEEPSEVDTSNIAQAEVSPAAKETKSSSTAVPEQKAATAPGDKDFRDKLKDGTPGPAMVWIPAGSFDMGSPGSSRYAEERPRHTVKADRFAISKYEITFAEYDKFAQATGRKVPDNLYLDRETHPVIFVTWDDAYYYSKWLSEQTGKKYRLASEAEWEYAAGAGKTSSFWWGFNEEPGKAHCFGCGTGFDPRKPTKVGSFPQNPFGVYDTAGNVAEWVHDCWHENYNDAPTTAEIWEGGDCAYRITRGGAFSSPPQSIRHAKRDKYKSDSAYDHIGIRLARDPD